jgi:hypothetical protein
VNSDGLAQQLDFLQGGRVLTFQLLEFNSTLQHALVSVCIAAKDRRS